MQSSTGLTWITESTAVVIENFLRIPVGENEYRNPSKEPIDIQPVICDEAAKKTANQFIGSYDKRNLGKFVYRNIELLPLESTIGV